MSTTPRMRRKAGDIGACKRTLWSGIQEAVKLVEAPGTPDDRRLRTISCLCTAIGVYKGLLEFSDLDARVTAIETFLQQRKDHPR